MDPRARRLSIKFLVLAPLLALGALGEWADGLQLGAIVGAVIALLMLAMGLRLRMQKG